MIITLHIGRKAKNSFFLINSREVKLVAVPIEFHLDIQVGYHYDVGIENSYALENNSFNETFPFTRGYVKIGSLSI
jgi:hypothetical protein